MYKITSNLALALANSYIGEVEVKPKLLSSLIHRAYSGVPLLRWTMYFYGRPDQELKELFGYKDDK